MNAVVNVSTDLKPELLTDSSGVAVTTKVTGDWTKVATLLGVGTIVTPTITHRANGYYDISFTPTAVGNWSVEYSVVVNGDTVPFDPQLVQVVTAAQADPAAALMATFTAVTFTSAVDPLTSRITIHQGDDEALPWTVTSPDITGASATLRIFRGTTDVLTKAASISGTTITVALTAVETAELSLGTPAYKYELIVTLAGGAIKTVAFGDVWVLD